MKPSLLVFNPNGDMDLILRKSSAQRTQKVTRGSSGPDDAADEEPIDDTAATEGEAEYEQGPPVEFKNITSSIHTVEDLRNLRSMKEDGQHIELRYRVSSAHLALASPVFKSMVDESFDVIDLGSRSASACARYAEALLILLDVIHGHHKSVPKAMSLKLLIELWRLIDKHKCHEAVEMFTDHWVASVIDKDKIKGSDLKTNMSRLYISWVFAKGKYFDFLVHDILESTAESIPTDLALPAKILVALQHRRETIVNQVLDRIYWLLEELWIGGCTRESCYPQALGTLMKRMRSFGLEIPRPVNRPIDKMSILQLYDFTTHTTLRRTEQWSDIICGSHAPNDLEDCHFFMTRHNPWCKCRLLRPNEHWGNCRLVGLEKKMREWEKEMSQTDICKGVRFRDFKAAKSTQEGNEPSRKRKREASVIITNTRVCPLARESSN